MSLARKHAFNSRSISPESRGKMIAAIQICWKQLRQDLHGDADALREERLIWVTDLLHLKHQIHSIKGLSDGQLGAVLDELHRLTQSPTASAQTAVAKVVTMPHGGGAEIIHLSSEAQLYTINILLNFVGWTAARKQSYLKTRWRTTSERMLTHKQCNSFVMHLLNIAAHKDLKQIHGKDVKISRKMTGAHIPVLKKKLGIDR